MSKLTQPQQDQLDAKVLQRLLKHLDDNKQVQNIDLMILADFCRNCLGKWYKSAADELALDVSDEQAREHVYGMPYSEWKANHQLPATEAQMTAFNAKQKLKEKK